MGRPGGARFVFKVHGIAKLQLRRRDADEVDNFSQALREYLQLESQDKKKVDFDFEGWEDYSDHEITVRPPFAQLFAPPGSGTDSTSPSPTRCSLSPSS